MKTKLTLSAALHFCRRCCLAFIMLFTALSSHAQWLTPDEAARVLDAAQGGRFSRNAAPRMEGVANDVRLLHTESKDGHGTVYVFGRADNSGVVMVGGLQGVGVLGVTDSGDFSIGNIPPALKQLMQEWTEQQTALAAHWDATKAATAARTQDSERQPIEHLVQTHWDQKSPYNDLCPEGCPTGCVATMFAQIMKYYNYPKHGKGSHSYEWNGVTHSVNFAEAEYEWDKMLDYYQTNGYDEASGNAVAKLMYHVGVAADMAYSAGESGAKSLPDPLITYFDYNPLAEIRNISGTEEDISVMYEQLAKRQPIPYSGSGSFGYGGHAFIVDGYRDGLWGINWGWGGSCDGYFRLGEFNPNGNYFSAYNQAMLNLIPNGTYTADSQPVDGEFTVVTPGTLKSMLGTTRYRRLVIHGNINGADLRELRARCCCPDYNYMNTVTGLRRLDLSDAHIVAGGVYYSTLNGTGSDAEVINYEAKENTLGYLAFYSSQLEELSLPASVTTLNNYALSYNMQLNKLVLPTELEKYGAFAICKNNTDMQIVAPEGGKPIFENNALYLQGHKTLCLVLGEHDKFVVDERCEEVVNGAFSESTCKVGTLVVTHLNSPLYIYNAYMSNIWIAQSVKMLSVSMRDNWKTVNLYLPSQEITPIAEKRVSGSCINRVYVPLNMRNKYWDDDTWCSYALINAMEDVDFCVDDRRFTIPQQLTLMASVQGSLSPIIYDSKIVGKDMSWSSSRPDIATVDADGRVTALAEGTADITLTIDGTTATCRLTVEPWPTVNVDVPGTLADKTGDDTYEYLRITGNINGDDIYTLRRLSGAEDIVLGGAGESLNTNPKLHFLDMKRANLCQGGVYASLWGKDCTLEKDELPFFMFIGSALKELHLPASATSMRNQTVTYNSYLTYLELPENVEHLNDEQVNGNPKLQSLVYGGTRFLTPSFSASSEAFKNVTLYVRRSMLAQYRANTACTAAFKGIEPMDDSLFSGIKRIEDTHLDTPHIIYNVMGQRLSSMQRGINIVDGRKVLKMK